MPELNRIRVLVVDDAVVVRKLVTDVLAEDPDIDVVGTAANGRIALQKLEQVNPDIVTMDVEMPELNGIETLKLLRKGHPKLPVIMFSTLTARGASATLDALTFGANDYVTKPANVGSVSAAKAAVRDQLIPKIKVLCGRHAKTWMPTPEVSRSKVSPVNPVSKDAIRRMADTLPMGMKRVGNASGKVELVVIGVSTGGPNALAELLPMLQENFPTPVTIVQHMPPMFTQLLAERLASKCKMKVREGMDGVNLLPGRIWIAPGGKHMEIARDVTGCRLKLTETPPENSCRPAADVLFRSAVNAFGGSVLGVVLTGMGSDGLRGCELIKNAGGQVIAQDEATSVVWGMPGFVARAGLADRVLPLNQIASEVTRRVERNLRPVS